MQYVLSANRLHALKHAHGQAAKPATGNEGAQGGFASLLDDNLANAADASPATTPTTDRAANTPTPKADAAKTGIVEAKPSTEKPEQAVPTEGIVSPSLVLPVQPEQVKADVAVPPQAAEGDGKDAKADKSEESDPVANPDQTAETVPTAVASVVVPQAAAAPASTPAEETATTTTPAIAAGPQQPAVAVPQQATPQPQAVPAAPATKADGETPAPASASAADEQQAQAQTETEAPPQTQAQAPAEPIVAPVKTAEVAKADKPAKAAKSADKDEAAAATSAQTEEAQAPAEPAQPGQPAQAKAPHAAPSDADKEHIARARGEASTGRSANEGKPEIATPNSAAQTADAATTPQAQAAATATGHANGNASVSTAASAAPQTAPQVTVPVPLAAVGVEIASKAVAGKNQFDIRLDPPELGRIEVRLHVDRDGNVTSRLIADRQDTLDLLKRDASGLERALQDAGLKTSDNGFQFSLRDQSAGQQQNGNNGNNRTAQLVVQDETPPTVDTPVQNYGRLAGRTSGLDIRV